MTLQELIEKYQQQTIICFNVDYGNAKSVRAKNKAVDIMYKIVAGINKDFGIDGLNEFAAKLLPESKYKTNLWVATQLLEKTKPADKIISESLSVIQTYSLSKNSDAFIYKDWIKNWQDNNTDGQTLKKKKAHFTNAVIAYGIALMAVSVVFYIFHHSLEYGKMNFLFFYLMAVYLLNSLYYFLLQQKIKKMTSGLFNSLSAICLMVGFAAGIFILLLFGLSTIQPKMILVFSPVFFMLTVWTGRKFWLGNNWYERS